MEIGNEISHKIRSAIKAKLVELGAYEDEELPDYIMVMVANKKTHAQMNEDLHLFLGGSTEKFTSWLLTILNKLKSITIGNPAVVNAVVTQEVEDTNNSNSNDDTGVPELLVQTDIDEFAEEQEENNLLSSVEKSSALEVSQLATHPATENLKGNFNLSSPSVDTAVPHSPKIQLQSSTHYLNPNCNPSVISHLQQAINTNQGQTANTIASLGAGYSTNKQLPPRLQMDLIANYPDKQIPKAVTGPLINQTQTGIHLAKVQPQNRKRRIPGSVIGSVIHHSSGEEDEEEEEYDPFNPSYGSVASVVRVTERKSSVPPELQANKCLLLKAVKEAHKSLATQEKKNLERALIKPMPHEVPDKRIKLSEKMHQKRLLMYTQPKKTNNLQPFKEEGSYEMMNYTEDDELNTVGEDSRLVECKLRRSRIAVLKQGTTTPSPLQGRLKPVDESQLDDDIEMSVECADSSNFEEEDTSPPSQESNSRIVKDKKRQNPKTQFIVTLDGYDESQHAKPSVPFSSEAEVIETTNLSAVPSKSLSFCISDSADEDDEMVKEKKLTPEKIAENCKFWPSCQNGTNCKYQHPSVACSKFPNCKFGDKCAYLHPKCKFDSKCNRFDCPFSHNLQQPAVPMPPLVVPIPQPPPLPPVAVPVIPPAAPVTRARPQCKFFPSCKNMSCPFNHPKPCRFGISCTKKSFCTFYHPPLPKKNQLRWKADKSLLSDQAANISDQMELNLEQWNNPYKVVNSVNT